MFSWINILLKWKINFSPIGTVFPTETSLLPRLPFLHLDQEWVTWFIFLSVPPLNFVTLVSKWKRLIVSVYHGRRSPEDDGTRTEASARKATAHTWPVQRVTRLWNWGHEKLIDSGHVSEKLLHWKKMVKAERAEWHGDRESREKKTHNRSASWSSFHRLGHRIFQTNSLGEWSLVVRRTFSEKDAGSLNV